MDEPGWITFYTAADRIRKRFDCGWADAKARLRGACADQAIDTMTAPLDPDQLPIEFWTRVAPSEWKQREVDHDGPDADGCKVVVMLNEDDFLRWVLRQPRPAADSPRDAAIRKLLQGGKRPPSNIGWKPFCDLVRKNAEGWRAKDKPEHGFSNKTIERSVKVIAPTIVSRPKSITLRRVDKRVS
jgi:hypothetical protein